VVGSPVVKDVVGDLEEYSENVKGYRYIFSVTCMGGWLVGCQSKNQVFPLGKVFVPQTVVWYRCLVNFVLGDKTKAGKTRIASGFTSVPGREAEYGFSGFITTIKLTKNP